jgi:hypothetical protein
MSKVTNFKYPEIKGIDIILSKLWNCLSDTGPRFTHLCILRPWVLASWWSTVKLASCFFSIVLQCRCLPRQKEN